MAIAFQQLGPSDAALLAERLAAWSDEPRTTVEGPRLRRAAERILADNFRWHAWLIHRGERAVGYLLLQFRAGAAFESPRAQVAALYLEPSSRSADLGRQACRFAADVARWLHVRLLDPDPVRLDRHAPLLGRNTPPAARWLDTHTRQAIA